jgi:flagellar motor switch protein FliG
MTEANNAAQKNAEAVAPPEAETSAGAVAPARVNVQMDGARKAAIFLLTLGEDEASAILKHLDEEEVQKITKELAALKHVSSSTADGVLEELHQLMRAREFVLSGGIEYARNLLTKSQGADSAQRLLDKVTRSLEATAGFDALQKVDPQQLAKLFQQEHPQTIALVLAHLNPATAADTINYLPENQRADIVLRMANLQTISQDVVRRISVVLDQKLKSLGTDNRRAVGGVRAVSELCNRMDRETARLMLEQIEASNPELASEIRNQMVTFDDLIHVDDLGIREILQRVDKKILALALKGTLPEMQERFFSNMSSRAVEMLKEEMEFMGQVKLKEVTNAQREIVNLARELDESGTISLTGGGDDEYVG